MWWCKHVPQPNLRVCVKRIEIESPNKQTSTNHPSVAGFCATWKARPPVVVDCMSWTVCFNFVLTTWEKKCCKWTSGCLLWSICRGRLHHLWIFGTLWYIIMSFWKGISEEGVTANHSDKPFTAYIYIHILEMTKGKVKFAELLAPFHYMCKAAFKHCTVSLTSPRTTTQWRHCIVWTLSSHSWS